MLWFHHRRAGKPFLQGGKNLDALDGIDAQIGVEPHVEVEHPGRIASLLGHDFEQCQCDSTTVRSRGWHNNFRRAVAAGKESDNLTQRVERAQVLRLNGGGLSKLSFA